MRFTRTLRAVSGAAVVGALLFGTAPVAAADQVRDDQWALGYLSASKAWSQSTGKGVTVAVIDNGVNGSHPDLTGNVLPGKNFSSGDPADRETRNNHGTGMASIIAGHGHGSGGSQGVKGLAPDAKILPIKNWDSDGSTLTNSLAEPLRYAVDHGAKVVNMSFAGVGSLRDDEKQAVAYAASKDVLLIAGSGNDRSAHSYYPAAEPGVLAVGAVNQEGKIWEESNYGPHLLLSAPGREIRSAAASQPYQYTRGTSDATAYVSGAAALIRSKFPDLTAGQVANRLTKTAKFPSAASGTAPDAYYGYGIIRPYDALTKDIPAGPKNGPLKAPTAQGQEQPSNGGADQERWKEEEDNSNTKAAIGIAAFSLIVLAIITTIVVLVKKRKKKRNGPPPGGGYGGPGGPGYYPPQQPGPYQQSGPYQQAGPYQQSGAPGGYPPPAPPNQPPGQ
ncbi:type VII secretion-associated serine protease mycosin [Streptomyces chrestomyceticus]|uniref:type VII secretion-associated serine protease mycosin n=1 Tax=Streptomyces chrestomyceticus TaxID=68185 RepID=UPI0033D57E42